MLAKFGERKGSEVLGKIRLTNPARTDRLQDRYLSHLSWWPCFERKALPAGGKT